MITNGLIILSLCLLMRLAKRFFSIGVVWALVTPLLLKLASNWLPSCDPQLRTR